MTTTNMTSRGGEGVDLKQMYSEFFHNTSSLRERPMRKSNNNNSTNLVRNVK